MSSALVDGVNKKISRREGANETTLAICEILIVSQAGGIHWLVILPQPNEPHMKQVPVQHPFEQSRNWPQEPP